MFDFLLNQLDIASSKSTSEFWTTIMKFSGSFALAIVLILLV